MIQIRKFLETIEYLIVYHGTSSLFIDSIRREGLKAKSYHDASWYMVSSTPNSAIFHSTYSPDDNRDPYLVTFKIPIEDNIFWKGYPYLWSAYESKDFDWYALKQPLPKEFIIDIIKIPVEEWQDVKSKRF